MWAFLVEKDNFGEIIRLERNSAVLMTYYRNNINTYLCYLHLLRVSFYIMKQSKKIYYWMQYVKIYPFLKGELFLHFNEEELNTQIKAIIDEFARQDVIQGQ